MKYNFKKSKFWQKPYVTHNEGKRKCLWMGADIGFSRQDFKTAIMSKE